MNKSKNIRDLLNACKEAKTIIYNLQNGKEKRGERELQAIFDKVIKEHGNNLEEDQVIIEVKGGLVQAIKSSNKDIKVEVLDHDNYAVETDKRQLKYWEDMEKRYNELEFNNY